MDATAASHSSLIPATGFAGSGSGSRCGIVEVHLLVGHVGGHVEVKQAGNAIVLVDHSP